MFMLDKKQFKKVTDFTIFESLVGNVKDYELEMASTLNETEEVFLKFMRYMRILATED